MEGQPGTEPSAGEEMRSQGEPAGEECKPWQGAREEMRCQGEPAGEEGKPWQGAQAASALHLVSAVAQWILLLACLIYLGMDFLRPSASQGDKVPWTHIRYTGKSIKGVAMNLTAELGPMQIRNGSILIPCDGLYLVSLKSSIYLEEEAWLKLTLRGTHEASSSALWEQTVHSDSTVNLTTALYLFQEDSITLWTNSNASISDLSFTLVLISGNKC